MSSSSQLQPTRRSSIYVLHVHWVKTPPPGSLRNGKDRVLLSTLFPYSYFFPSLSSTPRLNSPIRTRSRPPLFHHSFMLDRLMLAIPALIDLPLLFVRCVLLVIAFLVFRIFRFLLAALLGKNRGSKLERHSWSKSWMIQ